MSRFFSETPSIFVDKCLQSGNYIINMWKNSLSFLPDTYAPKNILMLGLGGGNVISPLKEKYPLASIAVIEWDEVMVQTPYQNIYKI